MLSGETLTLAVPAGQPEPLTVSTSMTMRSFGGLLDVSAGLPVAEAGAGSDRARREASATAVA